MDEVMEGPNGRTEVVESDEHRILFRHTTHHVGRMAGPHWHPVLAERFRVVAGVVRFRVDGTWREVGPGQTVHVAPRAVHEFRHDDPGELVMEHEVRPPGRHRAMFEVLHALHATGRLTRTGLPRSPLSLGLLWGLQDGYLAGPPPWLQRALLGGLDRLARRLGHHRRLAVAHGRPSDAWD